MKKILFCIILYCINSALSVNAVGLELTDVIKQARDIELQKELAVKNTVKEIKENIAATDNKTTEKQTPQEQTNEE